MFYLFIYILSYFNISFIYLFIYLLTFFCILFIVNSNICMYDSVTDLILWVKFSSNLIPSQYKLFYWLKCNVGFKWTVAR